MATPQELFDVLFAGMLLSDGAHVKDVKTVVMEAARILQKEDVSISDEQLASMPAEWRPIAVAFLFVYIAEQCEQKLEKARFKAEMN